MVGKIGEELEETGISTIIKVLLKSKENNNNNKPHQCLIVYPEKQNLGMAVHMCNPSPGHMETGGSL